MGERAGEVWGYHWCYCKAGSGSGTTGTVTAVVAVCLSLLLGGSGIRSSIDPWVGLNL